MLGFFIKTDILIFVVQWVCYDRQHSILISVGIFLLEGLETKYKIEFFNQHSGYSK
jgi:hypothetical protein